MTTCQPHVCCFPSYTPFFLSIPSIFTWPSQHLPLCLLRPALLFAESHPQLSTLAIRLQTLQTHLRPFGFCAAALQVLLSPLLILLTLLHLTKHTANSRMTYILTSRNHTSQATTGSAPSLRRQPIFCLSIFMHSPIASHRRPCPVFSQTTPVTAAPAELMSKPP